MLVSQTHFKITLFIVFLLGGFNSLCTLDINSLSYNTLQGLFVVMCPHYVAQGGLELLVSCLNLSHAGITYMYQLSTSQAYF